MILRGGGMRWRENQLVLCGVDEFRNDDPCHAVLPLLRRLGMGFYPEETL